MGNIAVVFSTYRCPEHAVACLSSICRQSYRDIHVVIADDGSDDNTVEVLQNYISAYEKKEEDPIKIELLPLPHGERGIARITAIEQALRDDPEFMFFIDSDMELEVNCLKTCMNRLQTEPECGALVIPEKPVSDYNNIWTRVKIFERTVLNDAGETIDSNSIEAARFWRTKAYRQSGGLNPEQTAFEEIQPTIRYVRSGGVVRRVPQTYVTHDEKLVTWKNLFSKKQAYFTAMETTAKQEEHGFREMIKRWYFFRPVLYRRANLKRYFFNPVLAFLMVVMYLGLSFSAARAQVKAIVRRRPNL